MASEKVAELLRDLDQQGERLSAAEALAKKPIHVAGDIHQFVYIERLEQLVLTPTATRRHPE